MNREKNLVDETETYQRGEYYHEEYSTTIVSTFLKGQSSGRLSSALFHIFNKD
jgi:hypothetical protein